METPDIGSIIQVKSLKHDESLHRRWAENVVLYANEHLIIGGNSETIVEEASGKKWRTTEPAIFYFTRQHWFNIIALYSDTTPYYYCNLSSPFTFTNKTLQYIDYDIDIIVQSDWTYDIVDQSEYEVNKQVYNYPLHIQHSIDLNLNVLQSMIANNNEPFNDEFIYHWYEKFLQEYNK